MDKQKIANIIEDICTFILAVIAAMLFFAGQTASFMIGTVICGCIEGWKLAKDMVNYAFVNILDN